MHAVAARWRRPSSLNSRLCYSTKRGSLAGEKAVERVGEIPTDLHHERAGRPGSDSGNVHLSQRELDDDEHLVGYDPVLCQNSALLK